MTVEQLCNILSKYPKNMKVNITYKCKINFYNYQQKKIGQVFDVQSRPINKVILRDGNRYLEIVNTSNQSIVKSKKR